MRAPIDIIISIIKRHEEEVRRESHLIEDYKDGMLDAYEGLISEFEGFKKLFS